MLPRRVVSSRQWFKYVCLCFSFVCIFSSFSIHEASVLRYLFSCYCLVEWYNSEFPRYECFFYIFFPLLRIAANMCAFSPLFYFIFSVLQLVVVFFVLLFVGCLGQLICNSTNWRTPRFWNVWPLTL